MTAVDFIANLMPWAGSLIPATLTVRNLQKNLQFTTPEALIVGAVVEGIGFVTIATAVDLYELNQAEQAESMDSWGPRQKTDGQFWVSLAGAVVYVLVVLAINALLESGDIIHKITLGLLSVFGVLGGLTVALRNQLYKRKLALDQRRADLQARMLQQEQDARDAARMRQAEEREERDRILALRLQREQDELEYQRQLATEKLRQQHELRMEKIAAEDRRRATENFRGLSGEQPAGPGDDPGTSGGIRRFSEIPESDYEWLRTAPVRDVVAKYKITGKDPDRTARTWKSKVKGEEMP